MTATIRLYVDQLTQIRNALSGIHREEALINVSIAEDRIVVATLEANCLLDVANWLERGDPDLANQIRRLDRKVKGKQAADWLRNKFGL